MKTCETCRWWSEPRQDDESEFGECEEPTRKEGTLVSISMTKPYHRCNLHQEEEGE